MATIITTDFGSIHDALNNLIIGEVKAALRLVPGNAMETKVHRVPLCRIVVSAPGDYLPCDLSVRRVWIDKDGILCFTEYEERYESPCVWTENDDMLDITDFHYLIEQCKEQMPDGEHNLRSGEDLNAFSDAFCKSMLNY